MNVSKPEISVLIPTWNRRQRLRETLGALRERTEPEIRFEVLVIDNLSEDGTPAMLDEIAADWEALRTVEQGRPMTLGEAHNLGLDRARSDLVLFINDDARPQQGLLAHHLAHHASHPEPSAALRGNVIESRALALSPFMHWLERSALRFGRPKEPNAANLGAELFVTINLSAKRRFVLDAGGFDPVFTAACSDTELGVRLVERGMALSFDERATVEHHHPTDLLATMQQLRGYGFAARRLVDLHPDVERPEPPALRHRVKAAGLLALNRASVRPRAVREETWRFLCHQSFREGLWDGDPERTFPRIGERLAKIAIRDPQVAAPDDAGETATPG